MSRLEQLEAQIEQGVIPIGLALKEIKQSGLYKPRTWEAYCRERWGWDRSWCDRRIRASEAAQAAKDTQQSDDRASEARPSTNIHQLAGDAPRSHIAEVTASRPPARNPTPKEDGYAVKRAVDAAFMRLTEVEALEDRLESVLAGMTLDQRREIERSIIDCQTILHELQARLTKVSSSLRLA